MLAYLTTKIEKNDLIEDVKSIDSQLGLLNKDESNSVQVENITEKDNSENEQQETVEQTSENQEDK